MQKTTLVLFLALALAGVGCDDSGDDVADASTTGDGGARADASSSDDGGTPDDATVTDAFIATDSGPLVEDLELTFGDAPVDELPEGVRFAEAIPYGEESRQVMDAFLPESDEPTAVVVYFHGGGFVNGSRANAYSGSASALRRIVGAGIAWIGVDYQLLEDAGEETEGVRKSIYDARRALQFVRRHAIAFNIDPARVGLHGSSAGAGTSLWLAFHPDMAEPGSADPISRQSTRPQVAAVIETQATYDTVRWAPDVFAETYPSVTNDLLLSIPQLATMIVQFYGLPGALASDPAALEAELETAPYLAYREELDMLDLLSADDPPTYVSNTGPNNPPTSPATFDLLHHPLHARALVERGEMVGAELVADVPAFDIETPGGATDFLIAALTE